VAGHNDIEGNVEADRLANEGAKKDWCRESPLVSTRTTLSKGDPSKYFIFHYKLILSHFRILPNFATDRKVPPQKTLVISIILHCFKQNVFPVILIFLEIKDNISWSRFWLSFFRYRTAIWMMLFNFVYTSVRWSIFINHLCCD